METLFAWSLRGWWLLYLLAGILWVTLGAVVLGDTRGLGLIFVGLACLAFGVYGAGWRLSHGFGLTRPLPARSPRRR